MYRKLLFHIFFMALSLQAFSKDRRLLDSLQQVLRDTQDPEKKVNCLYTLSYEYGLIEPRKGIGYGRQCLLLSQQTNNVRYQLNAYNGMGNAYETLANFDSARWCHRQSYALAKKLGLKKIMAVTLFNVGTCYKEQGSYRKALNIYLEAFRMVENDKDYNPRLHYYLGEMYMKLGNFEQAEQQSRLGIKKCIELDFDYVLPNFYINLAKCRIQKGQVDTAVIILKSALLERKKFTDQMSLCICLNALGEAYLKQHNYKQALGCFTEELAVQEKMGNKNGICLANLNSAFCYASLSSKDVVNAGKHLQQTEKSLSSISHNKDLLMEAYRKLADTYELIGRDQTAFARFKSYTAIKDSLLGNEKFHELNELQTKYATEKKEKQILAQKADIDKHKILLKTKKLQIAALISAMAFFLLFGFFFYNRYKSRQKIRMLLEIQRQEKLRENALKEKETEERTRIAKDIHDELGSGISKIFLVTEYSMQMAGTDTVLADNMKTLSKTAKALADNMKDLVWSLDPENNTLDNLVARINEFSSEFLEEFPVKTQFDFPEDVPLLKISKEAQRNIFLTFKEALNNVVKHAGATAVNLRVTFREGTLTIALQDNGKGFELEKIKKTGNGLRNMEQRIKTIGGAFGIASSERGTSIFISYPVKHLP